VVIVDIYGLIDLEYHPEGVALAEPPLQEDVEGLGQVVGPEQGPELTGAEEVRESRVGTAREMRSSKTLSLLSTLHLGWTKQVCLATFFQSDGWPHRGPSFSRLQSG